MKTRINLYLPEFRPPKELLTLSRHVIICLVVMCLMIGWIFLAKSSYNAQLKRNEQIQNKINDVVTQVSAIENQLASKNANNDLKVELARAKHRYKSMQVIMNALQKINLGNDIQYSSLLMELAEACSSNMSIEKVVALGKNVTIEGKTINGSEIPAFVDRFKQLDVLHQLTFASIEVGRSDEEKSGLMNFKLVGFDPNIDEVDLSEQAKESEDDLDNKQEVQSE